MINLTEKSLPNTIQVHGIFLYTQTFGYGCVSASSFNGGKMPGVGEY